MKLQLTFAIFFFISAFCFSQVQKVNSKNIENWINQNFSNSRTAFNNGNYTFIAFSTVRNGILSQRNVSKYFDPKFSFMNEKQEMTLKLKDLYYDSVTFTLRGGQYYINAKCINNIICSRSINEEGEINGSEMPLLGMISQDNVDINKCVEAFSKLIKFYGGKKQYDW